MSSRCLELMLVCLTLMSAGAAFPLSFFATNPKPGAHLSGHLVLEQLEQSLKSASGAEASPAYAHALELLAELRLGHFLDSQHFDPSHCEEANLGKVNRLFGFLSATTANNNINNKNQKQVALCRQLHEQTNLYLAHYCLFRWQIKLADRIEAQLSEQVREKMSWLFESLVTEASYRHEPQTAPYSAGQLARVRRQPPKGGLLLYISRFELPQLQLDENMKNLTQVSWADFRSMASRTLMPLCRPVCLKIGPLFEPIVEFNSFHQQDQNQNHDQLLNVVSTNYQLNEWLTNTQVCCKLLDQRHFDQSMQVVYHEVIDEPEAIVHQSSKRELDFVERAAINKFS